MNALNIDHNGYQGLKIGRQGGRHLDSMEIHTDSKSTN